MMSIHRLYMTNARFKTCGFHVKMHGSKVVTINTFHGDPRPSLWRRIAQADSSHIESKIRSTPDRENEQVSCCRK